MPVPNMLKLVLHWSGHGEEGTLGWAFTGNAALHTPAQLTAAAGAVVSAWGSIRTPSSKTQLLAMLDPSQTVDKVTLYEYAASSGPASELGITTPSGWVGTGGFYGPLQCSMVASLRTAKAGASYRGRQYFPGHCQALGASYTGLMIQSQVDTLGQLAANMGPEAASAMATSLSISTLQWGVYSPTKDEINVITSVVVDNKLDTQRRREANLKPTITKSYSV